MLEIWSKGRKCGNAYTGYVQQLCHLEQNPELRALDAAIFPSRVSADAESQYVLCFDYRLCFISNSHLQAFSGRQMIL